MSAVTKASLSRGRHHRFPGATQIGAILVRRRGGRQRRRRRLHGVAQLEDLGEVAVEVGILELPAHHVDIELVPFLARPHARAALGARFDQPLAGERADGLAHHRAADIEHLADLHFRRQRIARQHVAAHDQGADPVGHLAVHVARDRDAVPEHGAPGQKFESRCGAFESGHTLCPDIARAPDPFGRNCHGVQRCRPSVVRAGRGSGARHHRQGPGRHDQAEAFLFARQRSQIRQRPRLLRQPGQAGESQRLGRADRDRLLPRQPARPGDRRHQFGEAGRHRSHGLGLVDFGQPGADRRHLRPWLPLHQLPAADQGLRCRRRQADRGGAAQGRQHPRHRLGLQFRRAQRSRAKSRSRRRKTSPA